MDLWKYYDRDLKYPNILSHSHEKEIAKTNPKWAYEYILKHGKNNDMERIITKSAKYSYTYAVNILHHKRFKLGEQIMATDAFVALRYARWILKRRFELGEKSIATDANCSFEYAFYILKGSFPLGEKTISKDSHISYEYTHDILKKDFYLDGKLICKYEG